MPYKNKVLSDLPEGYWRFNNQLMTDYTTHGNDAVLTGTPSLDVPLVSSSYSDFPNISSIKLTSSENISINNTYDVFIEGTERKTFGIEFWIQMKSTPSSQTDIVTIKRNSTVIGKIYANADCISFQINGVENSVATSYMASKQVNSWSTRMHVFACYKDGSLDVSVNSVSSDPKSVPSYFDFATANNLSTNFLIGHTSGSDYLISDLAFYSKKLSVNEIRSHMFWGSKDNDPLHYVKQGSAYHFDSKNIESMFISKKKFSISSEFDLGFYNGLISDGSGLTLPTTTAAATGYGSWIYDFPITQFENFAGVDISWQTGSPESSVSNSKYVRVLASYDGGYTYIPVENNRGLQGFLYTASTLSSSNLQIKVEIYSPDTSALIQPRIDNLFIGLYKSVDIPSDGGAFSITPGVNQTYSIKIDDYPLINSSKNVGIAFSKQTSIGNPGYASVQNPNSVTYRSVEFWFKYDAAAVSKVIDGLTMNSSGLITPSGCSLYVNGVSVATATLLPNVKYHILVVYSANKTSSLNINGDSSGTYTPLSATYGFFTLYPATLTLSQVQDRYLSYLSVSSSTVNDSVTSLGSLLEYTGTSSQINGGQPVAYNERVI
jgi:hypothetical protein